MTRYGLVDNNLRSKIWPILLNCWNFINQRNTPESIFEETKDQRTMISNSNADNKENISLDLSVKFDDSESFFTTYNGESDYDKSVYV